MRGISRFALNFSRLGMQPAYISLKPCDDCEEVANKLWGNDILRHFAQ
jgi:hypothetical protein